jgi:hypothetical protein
MKKALFTYMIFLGGLLSTVYPKHTGTRMTMDLFLKATSGIRKDIGTAD